MLNEYCDVFALSYAYMSGFNTDIIVHHLLLYNLNLRQRVRHIKPEWYMKIKEDVIKQLKATFLAVRGYLEWLTNIVSVLKKDGKAIMCVDYSGLNKASL